MASVSAGRGRTVSDYNRPNYPEKRTPVKSIHLYCLDCVGGNFAIVRDCPDAGCALHIFRMGTNPNRKKDKK